jgi:hypothetical protein
LPGWSDDANPASALAVARPMLIFPGIIAASAESALPGGGGRRYN